MGPSKLNFTKLTPFAFPVYDLASWGFVAKPPEAEAETCWNTALIIIIIIIIIMIYGKASYVDEVTKITTNRR